MSPRDWPDRVRDILDAIFQTQAFVAGHDYESFRQDSKTMKASELNLIIMGEAANAIPQAIQDSQSDVPWHLIRAMRNRLVHVYFTVDPAILWTTIQNDLPLLVAPFSELLLTIDEEE